MTKKMKVVIAEKPPGSGIYSAVTTLPRGSTVLIKLPLIHLTDDNEMLS